MHYSYTNKIHGSSYYSTSMVVVVVVSIFVRSYFCCAIVCVCVCYAMAKEGTMALAASSPTSSATSFGAFFCGSCGHGYYDCVVAFLVL